MDSLIARLSESLSSAQTLEALTRPMLEMLEAVTGCESTYLTSIDIEAGLQRVVVSRNSKQMQIPEGLSVGWSDTLCKRALDEGRPYTDDVEGLWGDSAAAQALGIRTYVSTPVRTGDGDLYGTLCAASSDRLPLPPNAQHVLQLFSFPSGDPSEFERLEPQDYAALEHIQWFQKVGGYNAMNASRPQTIAVGLSDSPVALLAYSELFNSFGNGTSLVTVEQILTEVSVTWFANAAAGMSRSYYDNAQAEEEPKVSAARTGVAVFADDFQTVKVFAERDNSNIVHWSRFEKGGHFAALEVPEVVAGDIRAFFA